MARDIRAAIFRRKQLARLPCWCLVSYGVRSTDVVISWNLRNIPVANKRDLCRDSTSPNNLSPTRNHQNHNTLLTRSSTCIVHVTNRSQSVTTAYVSLLFAYVSSQWSHREVAAEGAYNGSVQSNVKRVIVEISYPSLGGDGSTVGTTESRPPDVFCGNSGCQAESGVLCHICRSLSGHCQRV